jgi:hypothetical protein
VLNSLTSASGQRTYDHAIREFVAWYCSERRLAFNRTVVLRYGIHLEQRHYAPATINYDSRRCAGWPTRRPMRACSVLSWRPAFDGSRACADSGSAWVAGSRRSRDGGC